MREGLSLPKKLILYVLLSVVGISMIIPFVWMLSTSFKRNKDALQVPPEWIPKKRFIKVDVGTSRIRFTEGPSGGQSVEINNEKLSYPNVYKPTIQAGDEVIAQSDSAQHNAVVEEVISHKIVEKEIKLGPTDFGTSRIEILEGPRKGEELDINNRELVRPDRSMEFLKAGEEVIATLSRTENIRYRAKIQKILIPSRLKVKLYVNQENTEEFFRTVDEEDVTKKPALHWNNYVSVFEEIPYARYYLNSLFVGVVVTFLQVFTSAMAAYAFSRLNFPGRDKLFLGYLGTMMIPWAVTLVPLFILMKHLNLTDSYWALILPAAFTAYGTFLLRQFFMGIPRELEEAAKIDGCSLFGIFIRIILPLSKPALATLAIFTFLGTWRSFMWPLIIIHTQELYTLPVGLATFKGTYSSQWSLLMAATAMYIVPMIIVFLVGQKYIVSGVRLGAIKG